MAREDAWGENGAVIPLESTWDEFQSDVETERGLFKVIALYADGKLRQREGRTLHEYLEAKGSRRFEAGLDLATMIFDFQVTAPPIAVLGLPTVAVGLALVVIRYGY